MERVRTANSAGLSGVPEEFEAAAAALQVERPIARDKSVAREKNKIGFSEITRSPRDFLVHFRDAWAGDSGDEEIINNLGCALMTAADYARAESTLVAAVAIAPRRSNAWWNLGQVYAKTGRVQQSSSAFHLAHHFSRNPISPWLRALAAAAAARENRSLTNMQEALLYARCEQHAFKTQLSKADKTKGATR